jgi:enoyl-CoA hydratase
MTEHHKTVTIERDGRIGWITIDNPPLNVLSTATLVGLREAVVELDTDPSIAVIAIRSVGDRAFSAGADVGDHKPGFEEDHHAAMFDLIATLRSVDAKPRICIVKGICYGGGIELSFSCDVVLARDDARFAMPEIKLGIVNIIGARAMMFHAAPAHALELALTGRIVDAEEAFRIGLISRKLRADEFEAAVTGYLNEMASRSSAALRVGRRLMLEGMDLSTGKAIEHLRAGVAETAMRTRDYAEGMAAFRDKRDPQWVDS